MTNRELFAWCVLAFICGLLVGLMLANAAKPAPVPPCPEPCADAKEPPLDFVQPVKDVG